MSKYRLVQAEKACFPINMMCRLLEISRSAYYAWVDRPASLREVRSQELGGRIVALHVDSDGAYGSPRLLLDLRAEGIVVSGKTVAKVMRGMGNSWLRPAPVEADDRPRARPGERPPGPGEAPVRPGSPRRGVGRRHQMPTSAFEVLCRPTDYADQLEGW